VTRCVCKRATPLTLTCQSSLFSFTIDRPRDHVAEMTSETPTGIQAISQSDIHRITSGQVVLDIQSAVKELVENALDAGARAIGS
jgi:hypothetical protein